jgi:channel protein (hemolysin III family)
MPDRITPLAIPGFADPVSSWTHVLGAALALVMGIWLIRAGRGSLLRQVALAVFVCSAVFLLSMSGVFHLLPRHSEAREVVQRLDHAGIFALIAGTFTPAHIMLFHGWRRWLPLVLVWSCSVVGITLKSIFFERSPKVWG